MSAIPLYAPLSLTQELAQWLVSQDNQHSFISKINYHLAGRVALAGASLFSLIEAISRSIAGCIAFVGYILTLGCWQQVKNLSMDQIKKGAHASSVSLSCFYSLLCPKALPQLLPEEKRVTLYRPIDLPLTPEMRLWRVRLGAELIQKKLQTEFAYAQTQAALEADKDFQYLAAPTNFQAEAHTEKVGNYEVGVCHFIGRRDEMEDEHLATSFNLEVEGEIYPVQLFGIFDGHGGGEASRYVKEKLKDKLHETLNEFCVKGLTDEAIWNALKITFVRLSQEFSKPQSGTTATVAMILNKRIWTANVGDSRTILDTGIQLSEDAKPTNPRYQKGIKDRGGFVKNNRVNGRLAVARAIGDHAIGAASPRSKVDHNISAVNSRPKVIGYPLSLIPKGSHLILACDGIYDVSSTRQIAASVQQNKGQSSPVELARNIVYSAYEAESGDNLSVMTIAL